MEFKRPNKRKGKQPHLNTPLHSYPRQTTSLPVHSPTEKSTQPIMSGRSLKTKHLAKKSTTSPLRRFFLSKKTTALIVLIAIASIGFMTTTSMQQQKNNASKNTDDTSRNNETLSATSTSNTTPSYKTVAPAGKSIEDLGGWQRVSPANSDPVFAYTDKIGDVSINVSQQPLPESFKKNTDTQVAELAKKYSATTKLDVGETKAFIGTSAKGPQSVIFSEKQLLILIKSQKNIDSKAWIQYITSLN